MGWPLGPSHRWDGSGCLTLNNVEKVLQSRSLLLLLLLGRLNGGPIKQTGIPEGNRSTLGLLLEIVELLLGLLLQLGSGLLGSLRLGCTLGLGGPLGLGGSLRLLRCNRSLGLRNSLSGPGRVGNFIVRKLNGS